MVGDNMKPEFDAAAFQEINRLIDEGESIREVCALERFMENGGAEARQRAIMQWLAKAVDKLQTLLKSPEDLARFSTDRFTQALKALDPQPQSAAQLRRALIEFVNEKLSLLNAMIGREAED